MPKPTEYDLQRALCLWLDGNPPRVQPALRPSVVYFHVPNGGSRNAVEGARFKAIGVKAGVPDLVFFAYQRFYTLELKEPGGRGRLSNAQKKMHHRLIAAGVTSQAVVDNLQDAKAWCHANMLTVNV
jgi:hypothetical protein